MFTQKCWYFVRDHLRTKKQLDIKTFIVCFFFSGTYAHNSVDVYESRIAYEYQKASLYVSNAHELKGVSLKDEGNHNRNKLMNRNSMWNVDWHGTMLPSTYDCLNHFNFENCWLPDHGDERSPKDGLELGKPGDFVRRIIDFVSIALLNFRIWIGRIGFGCCRDETTGFGRFVNIANLGDLLLGFGFVARHRSQRSNVEIGRVVIRRAWQTLAGEKRQTIRYGTEESCPSFCHQKDSIEEIKNVGRRLMDAAHHRLPCQRNRFQHLLKSLKVGNDLSNYITYLCICILEWCCKPWMNLILT